MSITASSAPCILSIVLVDTFRSNNAELEASILSILAQTNVDWELLLVSDYIANNHPLRLDSRVIILSDNNSRFYDVLNTITRCSQGIFVTFLCSGELLSEQCVERVATAYKKNNLMQLAVADESYLDGGHHSNTPFFKPDWNVDYLLGYNYFSLGVIYKQKLFLGIGGFDCNINDPYHDLALRLTSSLLDKEIVHIDFILFYFKHRVFDKVYENKFKLPQLLPLVSVIIPTRDQYKLLKKCIYDLQNKTSYKNIEIIIIDNKSKESETLYFFNKVIIKSYISIIRYNKKFNYSEMNNIAVSQAKGKFIALLNNDISVINENWLTEMVSQASRPEIGCVGAKLFYPDGTIQHAGVILGLKGYASHAHKGFPGDSTGYFNRLVVVHNVSAVTAACLVMRKEIFEEVGGFDAANLKIAYNDVDLCLKVREAGYRNLFTPHAQLIHHESKSRGKKRSFWQRRQLRAESRFLRKKWGDVLFSDPAYNKNLTLLREDFSVKDDDEKV